jgi:hypothetical protein
MFCSDGHRKKILTYQKDGFFLVEKISFWILARPGRFFSIPFKFLTPIKPPTQKNQSKAPLKNPHQNPTQKPHQKPSSKDTIKCFKNHIKNTLQRTTSKTQLKNPHQKPTSKTPLKNSTQISKSALTFHVLL